MTTDMTCKDCNGYGDLEVYEEGRLRVEKCQLCKGSGILDADMLRHFRLSLLAHEIVWNETNLETIVWRASNPDWAQREAEEDYYQLDPQAALAERARARAVLTEDAYEALGALDEPSLALLEAWVPLAKAERQKKMRAQAFEAEIARRGVQRLGRAAQALADHVRAQGFSL